MVQSIYSYEVKLEVILTREIMMKVEPLSDRFFRVNENSKYIFENRLIEEDRLKAAVEWLKIVIKATRDDMPTKLLKDCLTRDGGELDQACGNIISTKEE